MYKFTGKKHMTIGIKEKLPAVIVMYIFQIIEDRKKT